MAKAVCVLKGDGCTGIVTLTQASEEAPTKIEGKVSSLVCFLRPYWWREESNIFSWHVI